MAAEGYRFSLISADEAHAIVTWRYDGAYAVYNMADDSEGALAELLDRRSPYYAVRDAHDDLIGFFCFGTAAEVGGSGLPRLMDEDRTLSVGLGLRPDRTGRGEGLAFVNAGLAFARDTFAPAAFRLFVMLFNQRAIRVYEAAGFATSDIVRVPAPDGGEREFIEMRRPAE